MSEYLTDKGGKPIDNGWDRDRVAGFVAGCVALLLTIAAGAFALPAVVRWLAS
jgi:hypothetical protein